ncbi:MAG: hypothetical protein K1Y36_20225 [Blastocatellia bacterium]|nr:hypothetical protein [Blastocatellia bacterium]
MSTAPAPQFRIRSERPPERCEVCHQADRFDPETGACGRCQQLLVRPLQIPPVLTVLDPTRIDLPHQQRNGLQAALNVDEDLFWCGKPVLEVEEKVVTNPRWLLVFAGVVCFSVFVIPDMALAAFSNPLLWYLFLFALISNFGSFLIAKRKERFVYAVTNQRVLVLSFGRCITVQTLWKDNLGRVSRVPKEKGAGDLVFQTRIAGVPVPALTFSDIPDVCEVENIVRTVFRA